MFDFGYQYLSVISECHREGGGVDASHTTHAKPGGSRLSPQVQKAREQAKGALRDSGFFGRFSQGRKDASFPVQPERAVVLRSCRILIMMSESFFCGGGWVSRFEGRTASRRFKFTREKR